jgi:hypothetical protein
MLVEVSVIGEMSVPVETGLASVPPEKEDTSQPGDGQARDDPQPGVEALRDYGA